ncbi:MAG: NAD-dependent epimerase/dehydratase family protein [Lysobacterales bacterium]
MNILAAGGAGYIGSHTCVRLLEAGHDVTVIDNLCNSSPIALERVQELAGRSLRRRATSATVQTWTRPSRAASMRSSTSPRSRRWAKAANSRWYFDNNIGGTITLMQAMEAHGVNRLVFPSSGHRSWRSRHRRSVRTHPSM